MIAKAFRLYSAFGMVASLAASFMAAGDWPRFRGSNGSGVSHDLGLPEKWSETENVAWKVELPGRGSSSPIAVGDRLFVTCYSGYGVDRASPGDPEALERHLLCLSAQDGSILWQQSVKAEPAEDRYEGFLREHGYATSTPASDGQHVYVFFGKTGVLAYDIQGNQLWRTQVGSDSGLNGWGSGASPVVYQDLVIVNADAEGEAIVAIHKDTGSEVWRASAKGYKGSWSTPILVDVGGKQELVVVVPGELWGLDPTDGGLLWFCETGPTPAANTSAVASDGLVYAVSGGPGRSTAIAVRAGGRDDVSQTHVVWKKSTGSYVPSPVLLDGHLYWVDDRGVAHCHDAKTGDELYRQRLPDAGGVYASLVAGDGKLFAVTRRKGTFVLAAGPEFVQLGLNRLGTEDDDFSASPAVSNGRLLLRSDRVLYCIGKTGSSGEN